MSNAPLVFALLILPCACATTEQRAAPQTAATEAEPQAQPPPPPPQPSVSASQVAVTIESLPEPDRDFLRQAAGANLAAIRFGELAANNGTTVEIRSLGREMVDTHTAMSDQLRTSAHTEGITLPMPQMTPRQQQMYDQLSTLSGKPFDDAFEHDVMALQDETIASFQNEAENGRLSELAMLANQSLPLLNQRVRTVRNQMHRM